MIRSSALLTVAAMAMLVAGVFSASLGLIYASIAVSILAALTLGVGVLLRRRELFGEAAAGDIRPGWAAAEVAGARSAGIRRPGPLPPGPGRPVRGSPQVRGRRPTTRREPAAVATDAVATATVARRMATSPQGRGKAASGAGSGSGRWPGSIAAKGAPVTGRRGGEHSAAHAVGRGRSARPASGTGPAARDPEVHGPAPREPARGDRAGTERDRAGRAPGDREPAGSPWGERESARREPAAQEWGDRDSAGREAAARGRADREPVGREHAGSGPERDQGWRGRNRDQTAASADRDQASRGRDQDRDRGAAAKADMGQAAVEREPAAWGSRDRAAHGRDQPGASPQAEAFRLPSADERTARDRDDAARRGHADSPAAGDEFWDQVSEELSGGGSQGPVRPAWPATAGPRAMGTGSAAKYGPAETGEDEPDAVSSSPEYRQGGPAPGDRGEASRSAGRPDEEDGRAEPPTVGESRWDRMVPPYVDDPTGLRRDRTPAESGSDDLPAGEDSPSGAAAGAVGQDPDSVWSPWSSFRATRQEEQAVSGGRDLRGPGEQGDQDQRPEQPERGEQPGRDERPEPGERRDAQRRNPRRMRGRTGRCRGEPSLARHAGPRPE